METISKQTSKKISFLQVVFTVMVVYIHAYNLEVYAISNSGGINSFCYYLERILYYLTTVAVPGFFFLSGYLLYITLTKDNIIKKYKSRLFSLLIPYVIWNLIGFVFWIVIENIPVIAQKLSTQHMWTLSLSSLVNAFILPVDGPLWYMRNLFAVLLVAVPIWYVIKRKAGVVFLAALLIASIVIRSDKYNLVYDVFLFALGGYVALHFNKQFQSNNGTIRLISIGTIAVYIIISILFPELDYNKYGTQLLADTLLFGCFWFGFNNITIMQSRIPISISETRTFIYFSHSILLESIEKLFLIIFGKSTVAALVDYLVLPIFAIVVLTLFGKLLKNKVPKLWKILNGYR